ncbi:MAG: MFS transporter, partial [Collinsella sp.]
YADGASVVATSLAVLFMNVFVIMGSFAGGAALDAWGPRRHFLLSTVGTLATGAAILVFGSATGIVLLGAVLLGFVMGFAQPIATSYPAYLTDDPVELKDINSAIAMFSNVSIIVGPTGRLCRSCCVVACGVRAHDDLYRTGARRRLGL